MNVCTSNTRISILRVDESEESSEIQINNDNSQQKVQLDVVP